jgi:predicted SAM-dependent methyltransferase
MNYFVTAAALKAASANSLTRSTYRALTRLKSGPRAPQIDRGVWLLPALPTHTARLLELGTGWVHAYSLYPALLRSDELHCFDTSDNRHFKSFKATVPIICSQIHDREYWTHDPQTLAQVEDLATAIAEVSDFGEAYRILGMAYQCRASGIPDYAADYFDVIFSIDVLEHVDAEIFPVAAAAWFRILKPGGKFLAQVGIDDHLAMYQGKVGSKRYLRYSHRTWEWLLGNEVQYINRLTASEIVNILTDAGLVIDEVKTDSSGDTEPDQVHPDYRSQSDDDIRAVRLLVKAHKL